MESCKPAPGGAPASEALLRLQRGEINLDAYLELQIDEAVSHLVGKLSEEHMQTVRETLREQLETDPMLIEEVYKTTGLRPTPREPT